MLIYNIDDEEMIILISVQLLAPLLVGASSNASFEKSVGMMIKMILL